MAAYLCRVTLLQAAARAWVVNQPVVKTSAIVVLGGGIENRPFAAARLFHQGVAPRILFMDVKLDPAEELGVCPSEEDQTRQILLRNNVPESAMVAIGTNVASTYDESRAVLAWATQNGASSILIVTDPFHTRRARWIFRHEFQAAPVKIYVTAVDPLRYKMNDWWRHEEGLVAFQNEILKTIYYHIKY